MLGSGKSVLIPLHGAIQTPTTYVRGKYTRISFRSTSKHSLVYSFGPTFFHGWTLYFRSHLGRSVRSASMKRRPIVQYVMIVTRMVIVLNIVEGENVSFMRRYISCAQAVLLTAMVISMTATFDGLAISTVLCSLRSHHGGMNSIRETRNFCRAARTYTVDAFVLPPGHFLTGFGARWSVPVASDPTGRPSVTVRVAATVMLWGRLR